jgi:hypothetical protein
LPLHLPYGLAGNRQFFIRISLYGPRVELV